MRALRGCLLVLAAAGCGSSTETTSDGRIRVQVQTSGADPQSNNYLVVLDGERTMSLSPNGFTVYNDVTEGTHVVHLFSLADNCSVSGGTSPQSVQVREGDLSQVTFRVVCGTPVNGGFRVSVQTTGNLVDDDGYQLSVAGTALRTIPVNADEVYEGLLPGVHLVTLKDVADFCQVLGANPERYTVVAGKSVLVSIRVVCGEGPGPLN